MATHNLTSTATFVSATTAAFGYQIKQSALTPNGFFSITRTSRGVTITKATTLHGSQSALAFPQTISDLRDLAPELLKFVT